MEGGKLIGQGTYGCVFQPSLLCKKKQISKSKVGKITDVEDTDRELHAASILNKIKEHKDYFLVVEESCSPRIEESQIDPDLNKCRFLNKHRLGDLQLLSMPYGGNDLYKHTLITKDNIPFFILMKHLLEAGTLMLMNGFLHYDIHNGNILIDKFGIPRLIDFGQSFAVNEISLDVIRNRWKVLDTNYSAEPPEVTFLTALDEFNKYTFDEAIDEVMPKKNIFKLVEKLLAVPLNTQVEKLESFFKSSKAFADQDAIKFWKLYYPGFDSWAIGVILLEYLNKLIFSYEFVEGSEWKLKRILITDILRKMLSSNPRERIDCAEALSMLDPFNDIYQEYAVDWVTKKKEQRRKL